MSFDKMFERLIGHEGKYQDDYHDRGNWTTGKIGQGQLNGTKYGISAMSYPNEDIKNLTLARAKEIYYRDFWSRFQGDSIHSAVAYQLFDAAVNHGPGNAVRMLQRAIDVADDGVFGPHTAGVLELFGVDDALMKFNAERITFFTKLSTFDRYGRGWMRRVADNLRYAADDFDAPWHERVEVY